MEGLTRIVVPRAMRFEQLAPTIRQRHEIACRSPDRRTRRVGAGLPIGDVRGPRATGRRPAAVIAKVVNRDHAKGSNGRERADLRATRVVPLAASETGSRSRPRGRSRPSVKTSRGSTASLSRGSRPSRRRVRGWAVPACHPIGSRRGTT